MVDGLAVKKHFVELLICIIEKLDKGLKEYDPNKSYLNKIDELGRTPFPIFIWIIISIMVIIEAFGFGYILAEFFNRGASEAIQIYDAFGIAINSYLFYWFGLHTLWDMNI